MIRIFHILENMSNKNSSKNVCKKYLPGDGILYVCPPAPVDPSDRRLSWWEPPPVHNKILERCVKEYLFLYRLEHELNNNWMYLTMTSESVIAYPGLLYPEAVKLCMIKNFHILKNMSNKNSSQNVCKQSLPGNGILCVCPSAPVDPSDRHLSCWEPPPMHNKILERCVK